MEKQKKEPLATEIIQEQEQELSRILVELETLKEDAERTRFILGELSEMVDIEPISKEEILFFANNQCRIYGYTDLAFDYIGRIESTLEDLIIKINRNVCKETAETEEKAGGCND